MYTNTSGKALPSGNRGSGHRSAHPEYAFPVGGSGRETLVTDAGGTCYVICRTERRQRGWGIHTADGSLLTSGWSTRARAVAYAERLIQGVPAGGAR